MIGLIKNTWKISDESYAKKAKIVRFLISGGSATLANIFFTYIFGDVVGAWYIFASALGFLVGFWVSFILQKFWTFRDRDRGRIHRQALLFFITILGGLFVNTVFVYALVEYVSLHYLLAQIISGAIIAVANFTIYGRIFKQS